MGWLDITMTTKKKRKKSHMQCLSMNGFCSFSNALYGSEVIKGIGVKPQICFMDQVPVNRLKS